MHALSEISVFKDVRLQFESVQREKKKGRRTYKLSEEQLRAPGVKLINLSKGNVGMRQEICMASGHILKCCSL